MSPIHRFLVVVLLLATTARPARADDQALGIHPAVAQLSRALDAAEGPARYAALRDLFAAWDTSDPTPIEATLRRVAADPKFDAPHRSYAALLEAYARRRRGDFDGADRRIEALGFARSWLVVGPFENRNREGLASRYAPEFELAGPIFEDRAFQGKERPVAWRAAAGAPRLGILDLGGMMRPNRAVCAYATTYVRSPDDRRVTLFAGTAGAFKLFFDDVEVLVDGSYRQLDADRHAVSVSLEGGRLHRVTAKVCGDEDPPAITLRVADEHGSPMPSLWVEASERTSVAAATIRRAIERGRVRKSAAPKRAELRGAIQAFDVWLSSDPNDEARLESYARYLYVTGGDGADDHDARDFAERAAKKAPTVDRALLAAALAEDRNGRRAWLVRARALVQTPAEHARVLRAEVELERSGPAPAARYRLAQELVRVDPLDPVGRLAIVEQLIEGGLGRTAAAELERAIELQPRCLVLLRAGAGHLRALGRDAAAAAVERDYEVFRADDASVIERALDVAVARRDAVRAEALSSSLLASQPMNPWAYDRVARARRALGDVEGAVRTYRLLLAHAPEDVASLRALADIYGERGDLEYSRDLLRQVVRLAPQDPSARDYLERLEPSRSRDDERFAWPEEKFRELASVPASGNAASRTLRSLVATTVWDSGLASHFHQRVIQPLTEEAARRARRFAFAYHADRQAVELRGVRVFRKDGRVDETVTTGEAPLDDPELNLYTLERMFYVQLPELHPGDVVDLRYRVDDVAPQSELADYVAELQYLQERDPVLSAEYVISTPSARPLLIRATGLEGLESSSETVGQRTTRRFVARNLPGYVAEIGSSPAAEALGYIHASSVDGWQALGRWYWGLAKEKVQPDDEIRRLAAEITKDATDTEGRVAAVYRFAATELRYVALEFGIEGIRPRRAALTVARGWGDCKDKAAVIVALLGALGIDAELVLVRTGVRGRFDPGVASLSPFDHAIAYVPSLDRYLDGTAELAGSRELPVLDRGAFALRITPDGGRLVTLPEATPIPALDERSMTLELGRSGGVKVDARIVVSGPEAASFRRRYQAPSTRLERLEADLSRAIGHVDLDPKGVEASDVEAFEAPVTVAGRGQASAERDGVAWSVPLGGRTSLVAAFATLPTRRQTLLLGPPRTSVERFELKIPAKARFLGLPSVRALSTKAARFTVGVETNGSKVTVVRTLEFLRSRVEPSEYEAFRSFCSEVDAIDDARALVSR